MVGMKSAPSITAMFTALFAWFLVQQSSLGSNRRFSEWFPPLDLAIYKKAGLVLDRGGHLYDRVFYHDLGFTYTPFAGLIFKFLSRMDDNMLTVVWQSANFVALLAVILMIFARKQHTAGGVIAAIAMAAGFMALIEIRDSFFYGQINLLLMFLVAMDFLPHKRTGIGIGLAAGIKLTPAIFIVVLLIQRRWWSAASAVVTFAATVATGVWVPDAWDFWTNKIFDSSRVGTQTNPGAQSLRAVLVRLDAEQYWIPAIIAVLLVACFGFWRARNNPAMSLALGGITACLVSPFSWYHHWVWVVPAVVAIFIAMDFSHWALAQLGAMAAAIISVAMFSPHLLFFHDWFKDWFCVSGLVFVAGYAIISPIAGYISARTASTTGSQEPVSL